MFRFALLHFQWMPVCVFAQFCVFVKLEDICRNNHLHTAAEFNVVWNICNIFSTVVDVCFITKAFRLLHYQRFLSASLPVLSVESKDAVQASLLAVLIR